VASPDERLCVIAAAVLLACGGNKGSVCTPGGPNDNNWPVGCDTFDCHDSVCDVTCPAGSDCPHLDCTGSPQCRIDCQMGVECTTVDCTGADVCFVDCEDHSACNLTCNDATMCNENCRPDSECLLSCGSAGSATCFMDMCPSPVDCGNGVTVCNRACP
jgi:hypothetical protein